jgi:hypothetical protein
MITEAVEINPGDIWESGSGRHHGLHVEILKDRGHSVQVKVLRSGANPHGMAGHKWTIERSTFLSRYSLVKGLVITKPAVETDLSKLLESMPLPPPPAPLIEESKGEDVTVTTIPVTPPTWNRADNLHRPGSEAKRLNTLNERMEMLRIEKLDEIIAKRKAGMKVNVLAREYRLDSVHMAKLLNGVTVDEVVPAPLADYLNGVKARLIMNKYGLNYQEFAKLLRVHGEPALYKTDLAEYNSIRYYEKKAEEGARIAGELAKKVESVLHGQRFEVKVLIVKTVEDTISVRSSDMSSALKEVLTASPDVKKVLSIQEVSD